MANHLKGCVRPGEMLLVLGRPGSGCSSFLKTIGNQRSGYKSVEGDICYGGTDADTMLDKYRSEGKPTGLFGGLR
jgi:ABC-type multidrug transport system ATPase subunit